MTTTKYIQLYNDAFNTIPETMVVTDMSDAIIFVNDAFVRNYGFSISDLKGKSIDFLRHPDADKDDMRLLHQNTEDEGVWEGITLNIKKDGSPRCIWLTTFTIHSRKGPVAKAGIEVEVVGVKSGPVLEEIKTRIRELKDTAKNKITKLVYTK